MMTTETTINSPLARANQIISELYRNENENVYIILDGARDKRIHLLAQRSEVPFVCLYAGDLPQSLVEVAPWLMKLPASHPSTQQIIAEAWTKSWGVLATSTADLEELRRHLRRFLKVKTEDGKTLVFRYYDPRVLRVYLPTCTESELATFFGPISRFAMETKTGDYEEFNKTGSTFSYRHVTFG